MQLMHLVLKNLNLIMNIIFITKHNRKEIKYIIADKNYTNIYYLDGEKNRVATTLKKYFEKIKNSKILYLRVHNSYVINVELIKEIDLPAGFLRLNTGEIIPIGEQYKFHFTNSNKIKIRLGS